MPTRDWLDVERTRKVDEGDFKAAYEVSLEIEQKLGEEINEDIAYEARAEDAEALYDDAKESLRAIMTLANTTKITKAKLIEGIHEELKQWRGEL